MKACIVCMYIKFNVRDPLLSLRGILHTYFIGKRTITGNQDYKKNYRKGNVLFTFIFLLNSVETFSLASQIASKIYIPI